MHTTVQILNLKPTTITILFYFGKSFLFFIFSQIFIISGMCCKSGSCIDSYDFIITIFDLLIDGRGYNHIDFKPDFIKEAQSKSFYNNNSNPTKVFFLNKGNQTIENDFAQLVFHNNNISDLLPFITAKPKSINKRDDGCWDFLDSIKHPCNSLVILDDYILTDSNELIEENLIELLKKIMPLKLNQNLEFQITIIGENQGVKLIDKKN